VPDLSPINFMGEMHAMTIGINIEELVPDTIIADELGQQTQTLAAWRNQKRGPAFVKVGRKVFYRRVDVATWLAEQRRDPKSYRRSA
jgi:hypothetical protein